MRRIFICLFAVLFLAATAAAQSKSIEGVWQVAETTTTGPEAGTKKNTQPSMYLFTKKHYSIIYVASDGPRPAIADITKATAEELRNVFVDSFVANAGTYEMSAGKLTLHPNIAKSPGYMEAGNYATLNVKIEGSTMTLTSAGGKAGPATTPTTWKLTRVE